MAWVESAAVFYLRSLIHRIEPYQPNPLPVAGGFGFAEAVRELATMVMLLTVGILAGRNWKSRLGYSAIAFGVWDILYYVFLKVMCGWPRSLLDWDVLFLLPLPWWGPVLAPVSIALLMIMWGTVVSSWQIERARDGWERKAWGLNIFGVVLALYVFMADSIRVAKGIGCAPRRFAVVQLPLFCWRGPNGCAGRGSDWAVERKSNLEENFRYTRQGSERTLGPGTRTLLHQQH
jgi:hypothetical protein